MTHQTGCMICGGDLEYLDEPEEIRCMYCGELFSTTTRCERGHYVCDRCHRLGGEDIVELSCIRSTEVDPFEMAIALMKNPAVKMHGPEHHFLVPAVLLSAYYNKTGETGRKEKAIKTARKRAEHIIGGFCGLFGDCGAAVGTGIFVSIITGATPLSREEWRLSNLMTAQSLKEIAIRGGPRCCKRNTFLALKCAVAFLRSEFGVSLPGGENLRCTFSDQNSECLREKCPFYAGNSG